jgi:hypothetical protein
MSTNSPDASAMRPCLPFVLEPQNEGFKALL